MKQTLFTLGLIIIMIIGQSLTPIPINRNNPEFAIEDPDRIRKDIPDAPVEFKLNMYNATETAWSEEFFGYLSTMQTARVSYCPDWHHWKEWQIDETYSYYEVIGYGDCINPQPVFIPKKNDFAPMDAVARILPH